MVKILLSLGEQQEEAWEGSTARNDLEIAKGDSASGPVWLLHYIVH